MLCGICVLRRAVAGGMKIRKLSNFAGRFVQAYHKAMELARVKQLGDFRHQKQPTEFLNEAERFFLILIISSLISS